MVKINYTITGSLTLSDDILKQYLNIDEDKAVPTTLTDSQLKEIEEVEETSGYESVFEDANENGKTELKVVQY